MRSMRLSALRVSPNREAEECRDPSEAFELLARLVVAAHEDDGTARRFDRSHEVLDPRIADNRIADEERLDRAGIHRLGDLRDAVGARPVRRDRLEELLDQLRLVPDPGLAEHLRADAGPQGLL